MGRRRTGLVLAGVFAMAASTPLACSGETFSGDDGPSDADPGGGEAGDAASADGALDAGAGSDADAGFGDGDASGGDGAIDAPGSGGCPTSRASSMVRVTGMSASTPVDFCIDATEATVSEYDAFLADVDAHGVPQAVNAAFGATPFCPSAGSSAAFATHYPSPPGAGAANQPVRYVTWCSAVAYCTWAGKRLCGAFSGGPIVQDTNQWDPAISEWGFACHAAGSASASFPYGSSYVSGNCNDSARDAGGPVDVASMSFCTGGFSGLHDMNGNVDEWINGYTPPAPTRYISMLGGSFRDPGGAGCNAPGGTDQVTATTNGSEQIGFRCCASTE